MKKKEVPQDNQGLHEDKFRDLCYAVDEDGNYTTVHSTGWEPKNEAMLQAWEEIQRKVDGIRDKVKAGELSLLAYFMESGMMDIKLLSQYTDIPRRKIRRHLKPAAFNKLSQDMLENYADALGVPVEVLTDMTQLEKTR